ncbi:hypothetical protein GP486_002601 [Trichoglossum hirsutum]|uniref:C2H2-type domain-containing protein n=1 Tax=Trichoglossum hirsutum TaxID=265104 RepID=A0A9P8LEM2_9PEZI|nr:hypothetical protein GP486_002601 [Trichoglossum hirsutum]
MLPTESAHEISEDGLSDLENTRAPGSSRPNKRKVQHCAPQQVGRLRDWMDSHPADQCQWSINSTIRSLSKRVEALLVENKILKEKLSLSERVEDLLVENESPKEKLRAMTEKKYLPKPTQVTSSAKHRCKKCNKPFARTDHLLRHIRKDHEDLVPT